VESIFQNSLLTIAEILDANHEIDTAAALEIALV
jgi:hypothetical protein